MRAVKSTLLQDEMTRLTMCKTHGPVVYVLCPRRGGEECYPMIVAGVNRSA